MHFLWEGNITPMDNQGYLPQHSNAQDTNNFLGDPLLLSVTTQCNMAANNSSLSLDGANSSTPTGNSQDFFDSYYSWWRFWAETVLASLAALCNVTVLLAVNNAKGRRSVYNTLFVNLAVANVLSCILSWLFNNILLLFSSDLQRSLAAGTVSWCTVIVYLMAAVFVSNAFALVSTLIMLGFATVQYFAVCRPLHHLTIVRPHRVRMFIVASWLMSMIGGCLPGGVLLGMTSNSNCGLDLMNIILKVVILGSNSCIGVVSAIYLVVIALCVRIYAEIRSVHRCIMRYRQERDLRGERRAFVTILILLTTLTTFFIPYTIMYVVSLNEDKGEGMQQKSLIFYMCLMPYCKFLSDPLIYGLRMREVRDGCLQIVVRCRMCTRTDGKPMLTTQGRSTSFTLTRMNSTFSTRRDSATL